MPGAAPRKKTSPPEPDPTRDDLTAHIFSLLKTRGHKVSDIHRIYSAGDSGTGDTTVLYSTPSGRAKTALIGCEEAKEGEFRTVVVVLDGWGVLV